MWTLPPQPVSLGNKCIRSSVKPSVPFSIPPRSRRFRSNVIWFFEMWFVLAIAFLTKQMQKKSMIAAIFLSKRRVQRVRLICEKKRHDARKYKKHQLPKHMAIQVYLHSFWWLASRLVLESWCFQMQSSMMTVVAVVTWQCDHFLCSQFQLQPKSIWNRYKLKQKHFRKCVENVKRWQIASITCKWIEFVRSCAVGIFMLNYKLLYM